MEQTRKPVHPGAVFLEDVLIPLELTVSRAAVMMGITRKTLSLFVHERTACTPRTALKIAAVTRTSAESWLAMQIKLDLWVERQNNAAPLQQFPKIAV